MHINKLTRARPLNGDEDTYSIDAEAAPQLEGTTIRPLEGDCYFSRIAFDGTYICCAVEDDRTTYVHNVKTGLNSTVHGYGVLSLGNYGKDVHLLARSSIVGGVSVLKMNEKPDLSFPIIVYDVLAKIQIEPEVASDNSPLCWHPHDRELMFVVGNHILKLDIKTAERYKKRLRTYSIEKLIDEVQLIGAHEGEVTDLSMCLGKPNLLASASLDGKVKIWKICGDPLAFMTLSPYDGEPLYSLSFFTRPDHFVLIIGGPLNQHVKIWACERKGESLPKTWKCTQTLKLLCSSEFDTDAFYNRALALPSAGFFLLANERKNAVYVAHINYESPSAAPRMDYIGEFTVTMPILSLTAIDTLPNGEDFVKVYCAQSNAIQQFAFGLEQPDGASSPSKSPINSRNISAEVSCSPDPATSSDDVVHQLTALEKNMKEMGPLFKENCITDATKKDLPADLGKQLKGEIEASRKVLEQKIDKTDALLAKFEKENTNRVEQVREEITTLRAALEKTPKDIAAIGPYSITPAFEKAILSPITKSFQDVVRSGLVDPVCKDMQQQFDVKFDKLLTDHAKFAKDQLKGVGDKAVIELERSVISRLQGTVAKQIQSQFQKSDIKDVVRSSLEDPINTSFKATLGQFDVKFQKLLTDQATTFAQQQKDLVDKAVNQLEKSLNSKLQAIVAEQLKSQFKDVAKSTMEGLVNISVNAMQAQPQPAKLQLDSTEKLLALIAHDNYEEAFTEALKGNDMLVSWLCCKIDLPIILGTSSPRLSQDVLLQLLYNLASALSTQPLQKIEWMRDVTTAINLKDASIACTWMTVFDDVRKMLDNYSPATKEEQNGIRSLKQIMHRVLLETCR